MSKMQIANTVSRAFHKGLFKVKKHSPEILLIAGVTGAVTSAVMACKATTKAGAIVEEAKKKVEAIHEVSNNPDYAEEYTEADSKKDLAIVYAQTGIQFTKLYGPSILLGIASIASILASHNIVHKRNIALTAYAAAGDAAFKQYRNNVIERFGKELDRELKYNLKATEVEEVVVNEDGSETVVTKTVEVAGPTLGSEYAFFFDETCAGWDRDAEYNKAFLLRQQEYANKKLQLEGYLYLNDVLQMLGMPKTKMGQVVGWIYDEKRPVGDNYVDFGIFDVHDANKRAFVNGFEKSILLDFNVDGNIWKLMN